MASIVGQPPRQPERSRGLRSFLTWSFFLAQIGAGEFFVGRAAKATAEDESGTRRSDTDAAAMGDASGTPTAAAARASDNSEGEDAARAPAPFAIEEVRLIVDASPHDGLAISRRSEPPAASGSGGGGGSGGGDDASAAGSESDDGASALPSEAGYASGAALAEVLSALGVPTALDVSHGAQPTPLEIDLGHASGAVLAEVLPTRGAVTASDDASTGALVASSGLDVGIGVQTDLETISIQANVTEPLDVDLSLGASGILGIDTRVEVQTNLETLSVQANIKDLLGFDLRLDANGLFSGELELGHLNIDQLGSGLVRLIEPQPLDLSHFFEVQVPGLSDLSGFRDSLSEASSTLASVTGLRLPDPGGDLTPSLGQAVHDAGGALATTTDQLSAWAPATLQVVSEFAAVAGSVQNGDVAWDGSITFPAPATESITQVDHLFEGDLHTEYSVVLQSEQPPLTDQVTTQSAAITVDHPLVSPTSDVSAPVISQPSASLPAEHQVSAPLTDQSVSVAPADHYVSVSLIDNHSPTSSALLPIL